LFLSLSLTLLLGVGAGLVPASAQYRYSAGLYQSPHGFGASFQYRTKEDNFNTFTLMADTYGVLKNRSDRAGVRLNFSHNYRLLTVGNSNCYFDFFAGSGASCGYVRDFEPGNLFLTEELENNFGALLAVCGTAGCHFSFARRIDLELSWMLEAGMHIRKDETQNATLLKLYKNGLIHTYMPQLLILFKW